MRDIRSDLQERANFIDDQIRAAHSHFEKMVQQLQSELDARLASKLTLYFVASGKNSTIY